MKPIKLSYLCADSTIGDLKAKLRRIDYKVEFLLIIKGNNPYGADGMYHAFKPYEHGKGVCSLSGYCTEILELFKPEMILLNDEPLQSVNEFTSRMYILGVPVVTAKEYAEGKI